MFQAIKKGLDDLIYDGAMFSVATSQKMDAMEASALNKFNSFVDRVVIDRANTARRALDSSDGSDTLIGKGRTGLGHILGRAAGGALIGAGVNGYEYSQTGMGFGGSFSMAESVLSGAAAGAIGGGLIGGLGAKHAIATAAANRAGLQKRYDKALAAVNKRGLNPFGSGKALEEGPITKLNDGADLSNRTSFWTKGINGPSNNPRLDGPGGPFPGYDPDNGLAIGSSVRPINPNRGGAVLALTHAQNNMNTFKAPQATAVPVKKANKTKGKRKRK